MRIAIIAAGAAALAALVGAGTAKAAPVQVSLASCYFAHGGQVTVPAGSDVTLFLGWGEPSKGLALSFEQAQTTTASLNGSPVPNASSLWGAPFSLGGEWFAPWRLSAGTLANAGDTAAVTMQVSLSRKIPVGVDPNTGEQIFAGPGDVLPSDFGCAVTAT